MGKRYSSELIQLPLTYSWAMSTSIDALTSAVETSLSSPLVSTGSGGSLTAAHLASWLHQRYAGKIAKAMTPLDLVYSSPVLRDTMVLMLTARGGNPDIIGGFKHIVRREPQRLVIVSMRTKSPLSRVAQSYRYVDVVEFNLPTGKDGFLATNSLLAFAVVLARAWSTALSIELDLPKELSSFFPGSSLDEFFADLANKCLPVLEKDNLTVLFGPSVQSAALDLESKFTEAALGSVQLADYRNFAHGRHHWMAKRGHTTGVLAFVTEDDRKFANKTLNLIPSQIPIARIEIPFGGLRANIAAMLSVLHLASFAGRVRGIDPGRPGVPEFGSKIYRLSALGGPSKQTQSTCHSADVAIERKSGSTVELLALQGELTFWRRAHEMFLTRLESQVYRAVVFDYDGTLCDRSDRYNEISDEVGHHLTRLLGSGLIVGVATGRGKSARDSLQSKIPEAFWQRVVIGYYNGADCGLLANESHPDSADCLCDELQTIHERLKSDPGFSRLTKYLAEVTCRRWQITVQMKEFAPVNLIKDAIRQVVHKLNIPGVEVVYSTHSVDVIAPGVTKRKLVEAVAHLTGNASQPVLCIGDLGQWPGNDYALLSGDYSLSVDTVSSDPEGCWNIAPPGYRGVQALLYYIDCFHFFNGELIFDLGNCRGDRRA